MEIIQKYFPRLTDRQIDQYAALMPLYSEWNQHINVISRKDIDALYEKHVLHSLSIARVASLDAGLKVVDIGTGGGFPGIPLAIFYPEVTFYLIDSIGKKLKVVDEVAGQLNLKNVHTLHSRIESSPVANFDLAVSRAVAPLDQLCQWAKVVLNKRQNQGLICLKGGHLRDEIKNAKGMATNSWPIDQLFPDEAFFKEKFVLWTTIR